MVYTNAQKYGFNEKLTLSELSLTTLIADFLPFLKKDFWSIHELRTECRKTNPQSALLKKVDYDGDTLFYLIQKLTWETKDFLGMLDGRKLRDSHAGIRTIHKKYAFKLKRTVTKKIFYATIAQYILQEYGVNATVKKNKILLSTP